MARITVEDCLEHVANRFCLVRLASKRAKQLLSGSPAVTDFRGNREIVGALREIADGKVKFLSKVDQELNSPEVSFELPASKENTTVVSPATPESTSETVEASP
jgi:DNA-directed RNA polymerase subunit omega